MHVPYQQPTPQRRWPQSLHEGITAFAQQVQALTKAAGSVAGNLPLVLLAVSGGADSLALAVIAAQYQKLRTYAGTARFGTITVDHRLQPVTEVVTENTTALMRQLGFEPVVHTTVEVTDTGQGVEAAARQARYEAILQALREHQASAVFTAHTADDQAEQVLIGLTRGSGSRSLAGMPQGRELAEYQLRRPLLGLSRENTEEICEWAGIHWWDDPMNQDTTTLRARIRTHIMPALTHPVTGLGPGLRENLVRTAASVRQEAEAIEFYAQELNKQYCRHTSQGIEYGLTGLRQAPKAVVKRALSQVLRQEYQLLASWERLEAVYRLIQPRSGASAGPVEFGEGVKAYRVSSMKPEGTGLLRIVQDSV